MKIITPNSLDELKKIVYGFVKEDKNYYRGQSNYSWNITPSLARNLSIKNIDNLIQIEKKLLNMFVKTLSCSNLENLIPKPCNYDLGWVYSITAQHYGLPTRLIDFSHDIYSAIEFIVNDLNNSQHDGVLIIYEDAHHMQKDLSTLENPFDDEFKESFFIQVPSFGTRNNNENCLAESRKRIQGSKLFYRHTQKIKTCILDDFNHNGNLILIIIPQKMKISIIIWLIEINRFAYNLYKKTNLLDFYANCLKKKFEMINDSNITKHLNDARFWGY